MAGSFKSAFAAARKAGKKEFSWNGKSYNTELAETVRPKARSGSTAGSTGPRARPATSGSSGPKPRPSAAPAASAAKTTSTPAPMAMSPSQKRKAKNKVDVEKLNKKLGFK